MVRQCQMTVLTNEVRLFLSEHSMAFLKRPFQLWPTKCSKSRFHQNQRVEYLFELNISDDIYRVVYWTSKFLATSCDGFHCDSIQWARRHTNHFPSVQTPFWLRRPLVTIWSWFIPWPDRFMVRWSKQIWRLKFLIPKTPMRKWFNLTGNEYLKFVLGFETKKGFKHNSSEPRDSKRLH